jgi:hypothetical protein
LYTMPATANAIVMIPIQSPTSSIALLALGWCFGLFLHLISDAHRSITLQHVATGLGFHDTGQVFSDYRNGSTGQQIFGHF